MWVIALVGFIVGVLITLSEPDLQVLAEQVPGVPNMVLMIAVGVGVGLFLVVALMRIILAVPMKYLLLLCYAVVFIMAQFVPKSFLAVAFDSGGVTTGPVTVPFILALGVGVSPYVTIRTAENDGFGLVALCLGRADTGGHGAGNALSSGERGVYLVRGYCCRTTMDLGMQFLSELPHYCREVALALAPIAAFFFVIQFTTLHLKGQTLFRIIMGLVYTYIGLVLFLLGVNVGFMPMGTFIGEALGRLEFNWILVPIGMIIGYLSWRRSLRCMCLTSRYSDRRRVRYRPRR